MFRLCLIALASMLFWPAQPASAYVFSSTYQPELYVTIDQKPVGVDVVIRTHQIDEPAAADAIFPCADGRCYFNDNNHKTEDQWQYVIERLNKKMPDDISQKPKARADFYHANAKVEYSQDITAAVRTLNFTPTEQKNNYILTVDTAANTVAIQTVHQGDYVPGHDGLEIGNINISPDTIRIAIFVLVLVMIFISFKYFPMGHH